MQMAHSSLHAMIHHQVACTVAVSIPPPHRGQKFHQIPSWPLRWPQPIIALPPQRKQPRWKQPRYKPVRGRLLRGSCTREKPRHGKEFKRSISSAPPSFRSCLYRGGFNPPHRWRKFPEIPPWPLRWPTAYCSATVAETATVQARTRSGVDSRADCLSSALRGLDTSNLCQAVCWPREIKSCASSRSW